MVAADEEAMAGGDRGRDSDGDAEGADSDVEGALGRLNTKGSPAAAEAGSKKGGRKDAAHAPTAGRRPAAGRQQNERVRMEAAWKAEKWGVRVN